MTTGALGSEQPRIKSDARFPTDLDPGGVGMIGIHDDIRVAPAGNDRGNDQQSRPSALDPVSAEGLGD